MDIRETEVIINAAHSQRKFLEDPRHWPYVEKYLERGPSGHLGRLRITINTLPKLVQSLEELKGAIVAGTLSYAKNQKPVAVVGRIISNIQDAAAAHRRNYPQKSN